MPRERGIAADDPPAVRQRRVQIGLSQAALAHVVTQALRVGSLAETRRRLDAGKEVPRAEANALQRRALRADVSETQVRRIEQGHRVEGHGLVPVLVCLKLRPTPDIAGPSREQTAGDWVRELRRRFGVSGPSLCDHAPGLVLGASGLRTTNLSLTTLNALETSADGVPDVSIVQKVIRGLHAHDVGVKREHVLNAFMRQVDNPEAWLAGARQKVSEMISEAAAGGDVPDDDALAHSHALAYLDPSRKKTPRASSQPAVVGLTPELVDLFAMRRVLNAIRT